MNLHSPRPDRSANAVAERKKIADSAHASNMRQGHAHDPVLEAANDRFVVGDITMDEFREEMLKTARRFSPSA